MIARRENSQGLILVQMESTNLLEKNSGSATKASLPWKKTTLKWRFLMLMKESQLIRDLIPGFQNDNLMIVYQG